MPPKIFKEKVARLLIPFYSGTDFFFGSEGAKLVLGHDGDENVDDPEGDEEEGRAETTAR